MSYMFNDASAFNQDLGWCTTAALEDAFVSSGCEATACGVAISDCDAVLYDVVTCGDARAGSTSDAAHWRSGGDAPDVFFVVEPATTKRYGFSTCGSSYDTLLYLYEVGTNDDGSGCLVDGAPYAGLASTYVHRWDDEGADACSDDNAHREHVEVTLEEGATYVLQVSGYVDMSDDECGDNARNDGAAGDYVLTVTCEIEPIANYVPETDVTHHAMIDLDVEEISAAASSHDFAQAEFVYSNGGGGLCSPADVTTTDATDSCYGKEAWADARGNSIKGSGAIRTLQEFATSGASKMAAEKWWNIYKNYWGDDDYADTFVRKAFDGGAWASKDNLMRAELVKKGVVHQAVWMYVLHEFEDAIMDCLSGDIYDNDATRGGDSPHAWDEGWAFYAGSIEGTDGSGSGQMLYQLAEKRCVNFGTCADGITGDANVNTEALWYAELGRDKILLGQCNSVVEEFDLIVDQMTIPLIQGLLRSAFKADPANAQGSCTDGDCPKEWGEAWAFAAAVLPRIHYCSSSVAEVIVDNLSVDASAPMSVNGYEYLKTQVEKTYECLGVSCADVGELQASDGTVYDGMWACLYTGASPCSVRVYGSSGCGCEATPCYEFGDTASQACCGAGEGYCGEYHGDAWQPICDNSDVFRLTRDGCGIQVATGDYGDGDVYTYYGDTCVGEGDGVPGYDTVRSVRVFSTVDGDYDHPTPFPSLGPFAAACYEPVYGRGCEGYIHMDDAATYGFDSLPMSLETCAAVVAANDGACFDGGCCRGGHFFYEDGGYCNCPLDDDCDVEENDNAGGPGQLYLFDSAHFIASTCLAAPAPTPWAPAPTPAPTTPAPTTPEPTPAPAAKVAGAMDVSGMTLAEAGAYVDVYEAAVADIYGVDASTVAVAFRDAAYGSGPTWMWFYGSEAAAEAALGAGHFDWDTASAYCADEGGTLCSYDQICTTDETTPGMEWDGDPAMDAFNTMAANYYEFPYTYYGDCWVPYDDHQYHWLTTDSGRRCNAETSDGWHVTGDGCCPCGHAFLCCDLARRRLQESITVSYTVTYASVFEADEAATVAYGYTAADFLAAVQGAAADAGVADAFAAATVDAVAEPQAFSFAPAPTPYTPQPTPRPTPRPTEKEDEDSDGLVGLVVVVVVVLGAVGACACCWRRRRRLRKTKVLPGERTAAPSKPVLAASAAAGAAFALSATETDVLGPLAAALTGLSAAAPPPLNCCLYPFTQALAELAVAARLVRFNKEDAGLLRRRGFEIAQKLDDVVRATAGLPTGRVEAVSRTVGALAAALKDAGAFLRKFAEKGAFAKLCSGTLDARNFALLDKRLCDLSAELGSALDLQQLALQTQRFQKIESLIQLLGQQAVDANNEAAARRAALVCGIERGSAVEREELEGLGLKLDKLAEGVGIVINQNAQQAALLDEIRRTTLARHGAAAGKALARQDKDRALAQYEVELDSCEPEPFARGGQGTVHRAEFQGDVVALKRVSLVGSAAAARAKLLKAFATELAIMVKLRSPRVVQVLGVVTTDPTWLGFVVEYMAGGTLRARLDETRPENGEGAVVAADEAQKRRWLGDVALGMQYLYARGVEHRDLKTLNVLLDEARRRCKVTDFGLSKSNDLNTAATTMATQQGGGAKGTPAYMAPELLGSNTFTEKTDVYAFAILIWEVLDGGVPWPGINPMQIGMKVLVQKARPPVPEDAPPDLVALMTRCWADDPAARPTFDACRSWLAEQDAFSPQASFGALAPQASLGSVAPAPLSPSPSLEELLETPAELPETPAAPQPTVVPTLAPGAEQRQLMVEAPPGCAPGMAFRIAAPDGTTVQVAIPEGVQPGSRFLVRY